MLRPISIATEGMIEDRTPLSIATRGLLLIVPVEQVVVVRRRKGGYHPERVLIPFPWKEPIKFKIEDRKLPSRDIHKDDEEVLKILVEIITGGYLN